MELEIENQPVNDAEVVKAVRDGNVERYRELVERHERLVFAVAWSRLGDAALAEDVTQEAFIKGFKQLWSLGDGQKFSSWIATIARRTAVNLGIRNRRELNKRTRWALEQTSEGDTEAETYTPETLRQALEQLPAAHRECLVLFYLENKSGAEVAEALGLSETALRVRLHRARAALRERLEKQLEGSLSQLRPGKSVVGAVMAGVLGSSTAKGATAGGVGTIIGGAFAKAGFAKWLAPVASFFSLLFMLPMLVMTWFMTRLELKNFRDQEGFRARLFRAGIKKRFVLVFAGIAIMGLFLPWVMQHVRIPVLAGGDPHRSFYLLLGVFCSILAPFLLRQLAINRSPYYIAQCAVSPLTGIVCLLVGLGHLLPTSSAFVIFIAQALLVVPFIGQRPNRMDYNLFLRATEGLLPTTALETPKASLDNQHLLLFARFLGSRWMVNRYRWTAEGLLLRVPAAGSSPWGEWSDWIYNLSWKKRSRLLLKWDGNVEATLSDRDSATLRKVHEAESDTKGTLESRVAAAVTAAWNDFRKQNIDAAERNIGQQSEAEVFITPPAKGGMAKATRWIFAVAIILVVLSQLGNKLPGIREWINRLKIVDLSEQQVHDFINRRWPHDSKRDRAADALLGYYSSLVLPPTNLFSPEALRAMRDDVVGDDTFEEFTKNPLRIQHVFGWPMVRHAVALGWISWDDIGVTRAQVATELHTHDRDTYAKKDWDLILERRQAWSWVSQQRFNVMRMGEDGLAQLRLYRDANSLDLIEREKLIQQIASVQVLSGNPPGQPPMHDWRDVRGLFFTPCFPVLEDTYCSLAALEILGGLDRIDREACIEGILRLHHGKGYFASPNSGGFNEYHVCGDWRDTYSALESLRILGALDRVKDLNQWQFRLWGPQSTPNGQIGWYEVDAWVCQQRLRSSSVRQ